MLPKIKNLGLHISKYLAGEGKESRIKKSMSSKTGSQHTEEIRVRGREEWEGRNGRGKFFRVQSIE